MSTTKHCPACNRALAFAKFNRNKARGDGLESTCRECFQAARDERSRQHRENPPEPTGVQVCSYCRLPKERSEFNRDPRTASGFCSYCRACERVKKISSRYQTDMEEIRLWLEWQQGKCPICEEPFEDFTAGGRGPRSPAVDHDHTTGAVRGILHRECNWLEGALSKDPERAARQVHNLLAYRRRG